MDDLRLCFGREFSHHMIPLANGFCSAGLLVAEATRDLGGVGCGGLRAATTHTWGGNAVGVASASEFANGILMSLCIESTAGATHRLTRF